MENIVVICITVFLSVLIICPTIVVIVEGKRNPIEVKIKEPPLEGKIPIGMIKPDVIGNPRPKRSQCSPPKYFEYPPMSDEVKKAYDAAIKKHAKSVREKLNSKIKPPLGLMPEIFHSEARLSDVVNAIERRTSEKIEIPIEWIEEYNRLIKKL